MKICAEIRGSSVVSLRNRLSGPADSSYGSPQNNLCETAGYRVLKIVFGSPQNNLWESAKSSSENFTSFVANGHPQSTGIV